MQPGDSELPVAPRCSQRTLLALLYQVVVFLDCFGNGLQPLGLRRSQRDAFFLGCSRTRKNKAEGAWNAVNDIDQIPSRHVEWLRAASRAESNAGGAFLFDVGLNHHDRFGGAIVIVDLISQLCSRLATWPGAKQQPDNSWPSETSTGGRDWAASDALLLQRVVLFAERRCFSQQLAQAFLTRFSGGIGLILQLENVNRRKPQDALYPIRNALRQSIFGRCTRVSWK